MNILFEQFLADFTLNKFLILASLCFISAVIDAMVGGGGLISLPAYYAIGLDPHIALGTNKLSASLSTMISAFKFWKAKKVQFEFLRKLIFFSFFGAILGVETALAINPQYFKPISFVLLIFVFIYTILNKNLGEQHEYEGINKKNILLGRIMAFLIGFYDGFLGPGTGSFLIFFIIKIFKVDFNSASGNAKILNVSSNITSIVLFIYHGKVNYFYGLPVALIMMLGAVLGTNLAIKKGTKLTKPLFLIVTSFLILKMAKEIFM